MKDPDSRFLAIDLISENVSENPVSVSSLLEFVLKDKEGYSSQIAHAQQRKL